MDVFVDLLFDYAISPVEKVFTSIVRMTGPLFVVAFYYLMWRHTHAYLTIICKVLRKRLGLTFGMIWTTIGVVITFNTVFNHLMAMIIKPGSPKDLANVEKLRAFYKERRSRKDLTIARPRDQSGAFSFEGGNERFEGVSPEVKALLMYRSKTTENLKQFWQRYCTKCNDIKPIRTHHCSVCNQCVFKMDHHCPWVNNCLGLENQRYFLLFTVYLFLGSAWYLLTIMSIWNHHVYIEYRKELSFLFILNCALLTALVLFNTFIWWLACVGTPAVDFWAATTGVKDKDFHVMNYGMQSTTDNLFITFGTYKLLRILSPSLRNIPLTGLEWSFLASNPAYYGYSDDK